MLPFDSYAVISLSVPQTARIVANNHIEFDTLAFIGTALNGTHVQLSTGSQQANGLITLSGKRLLLAYEIRGETNEGYLQTIPTNFSGTNQVDELGRAIPAIWSNDSNSSDVVPPATMMAAVDAVAASVELEFRFSANIKAATQINGHLYIFPLSNSLI